MKKGILHTIISIAVIQLGYCQQSQQALDYIAKYKDIALAEMVRSKIPASITLAQGIHESDCGRSPLALAANNHFGIKCKDDWSGERYYKNDDAPNECFRVYDHAAASYADHSDFLATHSRYAFLFQLPITDYKSWALGLKSAGYATNPKYPQILITTIETYNLAQYDKIGLAMMKDNSSNTNALISNVKEKGNTTNGVSNTTTSSGSSNTPDYTRVKANLMSADNGSGRKEYVVNGARALIAQADESPIKVSFDYNMDYAHILSFNDLGQGERFKEGEFIFLQAKKNYGSIDKYVVAPGESMRGISQKFGIKLYELYSKNQMKYTEYEQAYPGDTLYLQERRVSSPRTISYAEFLKAQPVPKKNNSAQAANNKNPETFSSGNNLATAVKVSPVKTVSDNSSNQYRVQENDTLYSIARRFNVSIEELISLNNLQDTNIHPGQTLVVSK